MSSSMPWTLRRQAPNRLRFWPPVLQSAKVLPEDPNGPLLLMLFRARVYWGGLGGGSPPRGAWSPPSHLRVTHFQSLNEFVRPVSMSLSLSLSLSESVWHSASLTWPQCVSVSLNRSHSHSHRHSSLSEFLEKCVALFFIICHAKVQLSWRFCITVFQYLSLIHI